MPLSDIVSQTLPSQWLVGLGGFMVINMPTYYSLRHQSAL